MIFRLVHIIILCSLALSGCVSHPEVYHREQAQVANVTFVKQKSTLFEPSDPTPIEELYEFESEFKLSRHVEKFLRDVLPDINRRRLQILKNYEKTKEHFFKMDDSICYVSSKKAQEILQKKSVVLFENCRNIAIEYIVLNDKIEEVFAKYQTSSHFLSDTQRDSALRDINETLAVIERVSSDIEHLQ